MHENGHTDVKENRKIVSGRYGSSCRNIDISDCEACPVRKTSMFAKLNGDGLEELHMNTPSTFCTFPAKQDLYRKGDAASASMVVYEGWVILYHVHNNGNRQIYHVAVPGDVIPLQIRPADFIDHHAQAVTRVSVCAFERDDLYEHILEQPSLTDALNEYHERVTGMLMAHVDTLGRKSAEGKIAYLILDLLARLGDGHGGLRTGVPVPFPLTQEHLGDWAGLTSVHVNRTLGRFREMGYIELKNRTLTLLQPEPLIDIAEFELTGNGRESKSIS